MKKIMYVLEQYIEEYNPFKQAKQDNIKELQTKKKSLQDELESHKQTLKDYGYYMKKTGKTPLSVTIAKSRIPKIPQEIRDIDAKIKLVQNKKVLFKKVK